MFLYSVYVCCRFFPKEIMMTQANSDWKGPRTLSVLQDYNVDKTGTSFLPHCLNF